MTAIVATRSTVRTLRTLTASTIVVAFKYVAKNGASADPLHRTRRRYVVGGTNIERNYCDDDNSSAGPGLHVATKAWCRREMDRRWHKLLRVHIRAQDIVAVPPHEEKFRVKRLTVVGEETS